MVGRVPENQLDRLLNVVARFALGYAGIRIGRLKQDWPTYFIDLLGYDLFSEMDPNSSISLAISRSLLCEGLGRVELKLSLGFVDFLIRGECLLMGGSSPKPASSVPHSVNWDSSLALIARAWSAILRASLSSTSFSSSRIRPRSSRFSDNMQAHSFSSSRIRSARTLLDFARSRFCLSSFLRTMITLWLVSLKALVVCLVDG